MERHLRTYTKKRLQPSFFGSIRLSVTNWIILINILVFIINIILTPIFGIDTIVNYFALQPSSFFGGNIWTVFTSMFMHANFTHLFVNMISLFFLGNFVERIVGKKRFLWFYLLAGIFAGIFHSVLAYFFGSVDSLALTPEIILSGEGLFQSLRSGLFGSPLGFAVGASGAIFGLAGLLAVLTPKNKVYLIAGPLIAIIAQVLLIQMLPVEYAGLINLIVMVYVFFSIFAIFSANPKMRKAAGFIGMPLWFLPIPAILVVTIFGLFVPLNIGNMAHLGGLIAGLVYGQYLKKLYPRKTKYLSKVFS